MTPRMLARQYATALFDVAQKASRTDVVRRDLTDFATLVSSHADLKAILESPAVPAPRKRAVVQALVEASGDLSAEVGRLLLLLAEHDRLMFLDAVVGAFIDRVMEADRVVRAEVTTAQALEPGARTQLADALARATGRQVTMTERVDAGIIGGLVAQVGSVVYDGSVARQIERLRERLLAEA